MRNIGKRKNRISSRRKNRLNNAKKNSIRELMNISRSSRVQRKKMLNKENKNKFNPRKRGMR